MSRRERAQTYRGYLANHGDLLLCLVASPVVGTLGWMLPATSVWFVVLTTTIALGNGVRWGFEEADDGRPFNPVAAIDGTMTTALYLVVMALVIPAPFLSCLGVPRGT